MKIGRKEIGLIVLAVLLVVAVVYIVNDRMEEARVQREYGIYQTGLSNGYGAAFSEIIEATTTCQAVPLNYENTTVEIVAVDCLNQAS